MDPDANDGDALDLWQGSRPRKRMRQGTKSCTECRRRKTRCTSDSNRPGTCRACRLRGTTCVEQGQDSLHESLQRYSLRERVVQLELVVQSLLRRVDAVDGRSEDVSAGLARSLADVKGSRPTNAMNFAMLSTVTDGFESNHVNEQMTTAPVLRLFDNDVVSGSGHHASNPMAVASRSASAARAKAARTAMLSLLLPPSDIQRLIGSSLMWWSAWQTEFPEVCCRCREDAALGQSLCDDPMSPSEVAKALLCLAISVEQLPSDYDYTCLSVPFKPQEWTSHSIAVVERFVINDDEFASTLAGLESYVLLSKYYINQGRLRKAWLTSRRAIEFAQLTGVHWCTTKPPLPPSPLFDRKLQIWCAAAAVDRILSLILGLPYAVPDTSLVPQVTIRLQRGDSPPAYTYMARLALVLGKLVDRDQGSSELSASKTLMLDEELEDMIKSIPERWWHTPGRADGETTEICYETAILQFIHHVIRAFAHLPHLLTHATDPKSQCCRLSALESARKSLLAYREFRTAKRPYLYRLMDFLAFTMAMLLVVHAVGYTGMPSPQTRGQDSQDMDLVRASTEILVEAGRGNGGTVASESSKILQGILDRWAGGKDSDARRCEALRVFLPYFGAITICPGKVLNERLRPDTRDAEQMPPASPCLATTKKANGDRQCAQVDHTPAELQSGYMNSTQTRLDDIPSYSVAEWELSGFFDDLGHGLWSGLDVGQNLDLA